MGHVHFGNGCCEYKGTYKNNKFDNTLSASKAQTKAGASKHPDFSGGMAKIDGTSGSAAATNSSAGEDVCVFTCVDGRQYKGGFKDGRKHGTVRTNHTCFIC